MRVGSKKFSAQEYRAKTTAMEEPTEQRQAIKRPSEREMRLNFHYHLANTLKMIVSIVNESVN